MNTKISLAPGAGAGIGKAIADELLKQPGFIDLMRQTAIEGLKAANKRWNIATKQMDVEPDWKVRAQWFFGLLAQMEGDPIKRIVHQHLGTGAIDPVGAMQDSPALVAAVERALENAKFRTRRQKPAAPSEPGETLDLA